MIETGRLILRHWRVEDASVLYKYASDNRVSELALWPTHTSVKMSHEVIEKVFMPNPYCLAIVLRMMSALAVQSAWLCKLTEQSNRSVSACSQGYC